MSGYNPPKTERKRHSDKVEKTEPGIAVHLSKSVRYNLILHNVKLYFPKGPNTNMGKYSMYNAKIKEYFITGFDLLRFNIAVRPEVRRIFNIKKDIEIDALLYLFPMQYFTRRDYEELPLKQYNLHLKTMIDLGHIELFLDKFDVNNGTKIYRLTNRAKDIVMTYYKMLSGESFDKPEFEPKKISKVDKVRIKLIEKFERQLKTQPKKFDGKYFKTK